MTPLVLRYECYVVGNGGFKVRVLRKTPRRSLLRVKSPNQHSTRFSQEAPVGVSEDENVGASTTSAE